MAAAKFRAWDDYFIPGTSVLRNKLGLTTMQGLRDAEEKLAQIRLLELAANPIPAAFDCRHMKAIHRRIFQDVYEWAGQKRVGPITRMTKDGPDVVHFATRGPRCPDGRLCLLSGTGDRCGRGRTVSPARPGPVPHGA